MKFLCLFLIIAAVSADVSHLKGAGGPDKEAQILKQSSDISPEGNYQWAYETSNGIAAQEQGALKNAGSEQESISAQGSAQWVDPNGVPVSFSYIADENGYQPQGDHIPVPPPIPEAILRALEYIKAHPPPPEN